MLGILMLPCVHLLVWIVVFMVLDSVVHELNPVRHKLLHLWRTFLACWIVWGETLLSMIFVPLLFLGCMLYVICSVPYLVLCTSRNLHVVPMMLYLLDYRELLFLYLVWLTVCSCNRIIQICGCRLIGGEELLIFWADLDWLLPHVETCTRIKSK